jgi:hypothetical protein
MFRLSRSRRQAFLRTHVRTNTVILHFTCPIFASYTLAFALQLKKKKASVRVAARTSQADTVQYKNNEQYNTQEKKQ